MANKIIDMTMDDDDDDDDKDKTKKHRRIKPCVKKIETKPIYIHIVEYDRRIHQLSHRLELLDSMDRCVYCRSVIRCDTYDSDYTIFTCCGRVVCKSCNISNNCKNQCNHCQ